MKGVLKQSTAVVVSLGPFLDKDDAVTLETGLISALDHATTGVMLSKNGGTLAVRHATVTASVYDAHGCYKVTLDTTDTATLGSLRVIYTDPATCLPVWEDFEVVPAVVYDAMVAGSDNLEVNATQVGGTAQTGRDLGASVLVGDKTGFALTAAYDPAKTAAQAGDAMALTAGERTTLYAGIWAAAERTLTGFGTLVADIATAVWAAVTRTLTSGGGLTAQETRDALKLAPSAGDPAAGSVDALITGVDTSANVREWQSLALALRSIHHFDSIFGAASVDWNGKVPDLGWEVKIFKTNLRYRDNDGNLDPQADPTTVLLGTLTAGGLTLAPDTEQESGVLYVEFPYADGDPRIKLTITDNAQTHVLQTSGVSGEQMWLLDGTPFKWATQGWLAMPPTEGGGGGVTLDQLRAEGLAKEATVLGQFGVTYGITYPIVRRDGVINLTRGDVATVSFVLNAAFPLTGKKVYFCAQKKKLETNATAIVNRACTITDVPTRACSITLTAEELATAGTYLYEIEVRNEDETAPATAEAGTLNIIEDLRK